MLRLEADDVRFQSGIKHRLGVNVVVHHEGISFPAVTGIEIAAYRLHSLVYILYELAVFLVGYKLIGGYPDGDELAHFEGLVHEVPVALVKMVEGAAGPDVPVEVFLFSILH